MLVMTSLGLGFLRILLKNVLESPLNAEGKGYDILL